MTQVTVGYASGMLGKTYDSQVCSIARALEVVGERWSLLILRNAHFAGSKRFGDFQRSLGIATNVLAARLDALVAAGVFERRPSGDHAGADEYLLTDKGRELVPVLVALTQWGDRWAAPDGPPILYRHAPCGCDVHLEVRCERCGAITDSSSVTAHPGPGMPQDRAERVSARLPAT
jgi:DNA-binding HxlR family transcriptional regulator